MLSQGRLRPQVFCFRAPVVVWTWASQIKAREKDHTSPSRTKCLGNSLWRKRRLHRCFLKGWLRNWPKLGGQSSLLASASKSKIRCAQRLSCQQMACHATGRSHRLHTWQWLWWRKFQSGWKETESLVPDWGRTVPPFCSILGSSQVSLSPRRSHIASQLSL